MRIVDSSAQIYRWLLIPLLALFVVSACEPVDEIPSRLRVGVLPDQAQESLERQYEPLIAYLSATVGIKHELVVPRDYGHLLELFREKQIDLAYFGGLTFLRANHTDGAVPIVMRDVDTRFVSYFLVRADNPAKSLNDLRQHVLAFGSKLSTSGHLMPRHHLQVKGLQPEAFFAEVKYSGAHDKTAHWVRDGVVDVGAVNGTIAEAMFADGRLSRDSVRVLWRTPPYPDYVWAIRKDISKTVRTRVQDAFLALSIHDAAQSTILSRIGAMQFMPVRMKEFEILAEVARNLGLLGS